MSTKAPALGAPYYRAPYAVAIKRFFLKYATFSGRASRSEYWWWILTSVLVALALSITNGLSTSNWNVGLQITARSLELIGTVPGALAFGLALGTLVPSLAITWRRLHDANLNGGWFFIGLIPILGPVIFIILTVFSSDPEGARFDKPVPAATADALSPRRAS